MSGTFKELAPALWRSGLGEPFPMRTDGNTKRPALKGVHGRTDPKITVARVKEWMKRYPDAMPGLIPAERIIIIDIDQHPASEDEPAKHGARELARALGVDAKGLKALLGDTLHVSGREGSWAHGHWYFEVPEDFEWAKRYPEFEDGSKIQGVEIIGPGRRGFYVVAPGAIHPVTKKVYRSFVLGDAQVTVDSISRADVKPLPEPLCALLRGEEPKNRTQGQGEVWEALELLPEGEPDQYVQAVLDEFEADPERHGTAHATVLRTQLDLVNLGERGHRGVKTAMERVRDLYEELRPERAGEFDRYLSGVSVDLERVKRGHETGDWSNQRPITTLPKGEAGGTLTNLKDEFTDYEVAKRLLVDWTARGNPAAWNDGMGWLVWDGKRWRSVSPERVKHAAMVAFERWIAAEDEQHVGDQSSDWDARRAQLRQLKSSRKIGAIMTQLPGAAYVDVDFFDAKPYLLNCQNGVVDLRTGDVAEHDPDLGFTQVCSVPYVKGYGDKRWDQIKGALEPEEMEYLLYRLGQAVTGYIPQDDKVCFLVGNGSNGKTTLMTPVVRALGGFAGLVRQELLVGDKSQHSEVKMSLQGVRLAFLDETAEAYLNPHRLKNIVGTPTITARHLYKPEITFRATHTLLVNTNYPPKVAETDKGTWDRLEQIKFNRTFDRSRPLIPGLREAANTNKKVWAAALADLVEHAKALFERKMVMPSAPDSVVASTRAWRKSQDLVGDFVAERLEPAEGFAIPLRDLAEEFNRWVGKSGKPVSASTLALRLSQTETLPEGFAYVSERVRAGHCRLSQSVMMAKVPDDWRGTAWVGVRFRD